MNLDRAVLEGRFDIIDRNLKFLKQIQSLREKNFLASYRDIQAAKHSLLEIIEACIDLANYIISAKGFNRAESYNLNDVYKFEEQIQELIQRELNSR